MEIMMDNMNMNTAIELVVLHNSLCRSQDRIPGEWKLSKRNLIQRIRILEKVEAVSRRLET